MPLILNWPISISSLAKEEAPRGILEPENFRPPKKKYQAFRRLCTRLRTISHIYVGMSSRTVRVDLIVRNRHQPLPCKPLFLGNVFPSGQHSKDKRCSDERDQNISFFVYGDFKECTGEGQRASASLTLQSDRQSMADHGESAHKQLVRGGEAVPDRFWTKRSDKAIGLIGACTIDSVSCLNRSRATTSTSVSE